MGCHNIHMLLYIIFHQLLLYSYNKPSVDICQSAAIWFCSFVVHIWCLTISSASACASQRTQQYVLVTVANRVWLIHIKGVLPSLISLQHRCIYKEKGKAIYVQARGFQEVEAPRFHVSHPMKVLRLSAIHIGRLKTPSNYSWYSFLFQAESTLGHSVAGRIMLMKYSNNAIGNQTRYLPACSAVPWLTVPPFASQMYW